VWFAAQLGVGARHVDIPDSEGLDGLATGNMTATVWLTTPGPVRPGLLRYGIGASGVTSGSNFNSTAEFVGVKACNAQGETDFDCIFDNTNIFEDEPAPFTLGVPFLLRISLTARASAGGAGPGGAESFGEIRVVSIQDLAGEPVIISESAGPGTVVPEPSTFVLLSFTMIGFFAFVRLRAKSKSRG
jgi:hypothetical protein